MSMKKRKFNSRFPPARIKKMMQSDDDVGKVAAVVPCLISKSLEIFAEQLMKTISEELQTRNARTLSTSHIKSAIRLKNEFISVRDLAEEDPNGEGEFGDGGCSASEQERPPSSKRKISAEDPSTANIPSKQPQQQRSNSNSHANILDTNNGPPVKRGRGRPRKTPVVQPSKHVDPEFDDDDDDEEEDDDDDEDY